MGNENLLTGTHNGHLMVAALKRHADKPVMFLGDKVRVAPEPHRDRYEAFDAYVKTAATAPAAAAPSSRP